MDFFGQTQAELLEHVNVQKLKQGKRILKTWSRRRGNKVQALKVCEFEKDMVVSGCFDVTSIFV